MNIKAASCSDADVQSAINLVRAARGGVAEMPAGTAEWTTGVDLWPTVSLIGSGDTTHIVDSTPKDGSAGSSFIRGTIVDGFELGNFSWEGKTPDTQVFNKGHIRLDGVAKNVHIHHLKIRNNQTSGIRVSGGIFGLIDHIDFESSMHNQMFLVVDHGRSFGDSSGFGDKSWATPINWGSLDALYIEDSTFLFTNRMFVTECMDNLLAGRVVVRRNKFFQCAIGAHGTDSGQRNRGMRYYEVYENEFDFPVYSPENPTAGVDHCIWIRGGTAVIFGNTVKNAFKNVAFNAFVKTTVKRDNESYPPWGKCDGTGPYDKNDAGESGYRCVDQVGAGTSKDLGGVATPPPGWVENELDPIHCWGNVLSDTPTFGIVAAGPHVKEGRDFHLTARPGYVPAVYPHPLQAPTPIPPPVNGSPTVTIKLPTHGQVITAKTFVITMDVADDTGVAWLYLYINGVLAQGFPRQGNQTAKYTTTYSWNTNPHKGKGPVDIRAEVVDADGAKGTDSKTVTVKK